MCYLASCHSRNQSAPLYESLMDRSELIDNIADVVETKASLPIIDCFTMHEKQIRHIDEWDWIENQIRKHRWLVSVSDESDSDDIVDTLCCMFVDDCKEHFRLNPNMLLRLCEKAKELVNDGSGTTIVYFYVYERTVHVEPFFFYGPQDKCLESLAQ